MRLPPDARLRADVGSLLESIGEPSSTERLDPLLMHLRLLARWNDAYNLTRITEWAEVLDRHIRESLLPLKWIERDREGRLLDVGSGNGFPAFPILACRPLLKGVLLERSERKGLFLEAVIRECGWQKRVEVAATDAERYEAAQRDVGAMGQQASMSAADKEERASRDARPGGAGKRGKSTNRNMSAADTYEMGPTRGSGDPLSDVGSPKETEGAARPIEGASHAPETRFDYVISRATLAHPRYLELASTWVKTGGRVLLLAGDDRNGTNVHGRPSETRPSESPAFVSLACERIPGRKSSYLYVYQRNQN